MNLRLLLTAGFTLLLLMGLNSATAQCTRSQDHTDTNNAARTEQNDHQTDANTYRSHCSSNYSSCHRSSGGFEFSNNLLVLGAATIAPDSDELILATGLEYGRQITNNIGVGALAEIRQSQEDDELALRFGVPINFRPIGGLQLSAGPLFATNRNAVRQVVGGTQEEPEVGLVNEWSSDWGARAGLSYFINVGQVLIAPTARWDYLNEQWQATFGLNLGMGF